MNEPGAGPAAIVEHLTSCHPVRASIVMQHGSADETIAALLVGGWTLDEQVDVVAGKRIRYVTPPQETL